MTCKDCHFFKPVTRMAGVCLRFPPVLGMSGGGSMYQDGHPQEGLSHPIQTNWRVPDVYEGFWCGEWKEKEP